jgi:hypothetical protein
MQQRKRAIFVLALSTFLGCERDRTAPTKVVQPQPVSPAASQPALPPPPAPKPEHAALTGDAEIEMIGEWQPGKVKAKAVVFVAQPDPCMPVPETTKRLGEANLTKPGAFFAEFFIPQGTKGHLCAYATDKKGRIVGAAAYAKNPVLFQGAGDIIIRDIDLQLRPVGR